MTSIKEALERIKRTALDAKPEDVPKALAHIVRLCIDADRTTVESGDARERIARAVTSEFEQMYKDGVPMCMREGETTWRTYHAGFDLSMFTNRIVSAILATGLVPDVAAIRADWHTTGWDRARNSGRILLVWREFSGVSEHVELGRYSDSKAAWVNTYGHPFHAEPDGWAPLLPFKAAESIRADEREKCAKVADEHSFGREIDWWLNATKKDVAAETCRSIAAAIRSGGVK